MSNPTFPVRLAAASALSAGALLMSVSPALAQRAPDPNYAGPSTVVLVPATTETALDVRTLAGGVLVGLAVGAGSVVAVRAAARRPHGHATA
jgi:hypothetical protein